MTATFAYKGRTAGGDLVEGTVEADTHDAAVAQVRARGQVPVEIVQQTRSVLQRELRLPTSKRVKPAAMAAFVRQLATMINAGLPIMRVLAVLARETKRPQLAQVAEALRQDIAGGSSLSEAMARHPRYFDRLAVAMVRVGEAGGALDEVLDRLATTIERQAELRRKVRSAMAYPAAVTGIVVLILTAMVVFIVPMFETMYAQLDAQLPAPTRMLLAVVAQLRKWWFLEIPAIVGAVVGQRRWRRTPKGRATWDAWSLRLPLFGPLLHKTAIARFARTLSSLLRAGVPVLTGLEIAADASSNGVVVGAATRAAAALRGGTSLATALRAEPIVPTLLGEMVAVGEETGSVDELMEKAADAYEADVSATVDGLTAMLEPLLVAVIGVVVGVMLICLYMPMFNIADSVK
jgi:type IV pilus assembly protein PilC